MVVVGGWDCVGGGKRSVAVVLWCTVENCRSARILFGFDGAEKNAGAELVRVRSSRVGCWRPSLRCPGRLSGCHMYFSVFHEQRKQVWSRLKRYFRSKSLTWLSRSTADVIFRVLIRHLHSLSRKFVGNCVFEESGIVDGGTGFWARAAPESCLYGHASGAGIEDDSNAS